MSRKNLPSRSFSNNNLDDQAKAPETFSADRRWVLGTRKPPIQIEKAAKFPDPEQQDKTLTMFAKSGIYSMRIYDQYQIIFKCLTKKEGAKEPVEETSKDMKSATPVETISPAPVGGFLLNLRNRGLIYFTNFGNQIPIALTEENESWNVPISLTSFYWIMPSNREMFALVGSMFGHVYKMSIVYKSQTIPVMKLYEDENKTPVASISSIINYDRRYLLVTTFRSLKVLSWDNTDEKPTEVHSFVPPSGPNICVPSFVCSNQTHVSWLTHDDLRIYTYSQAIGEAPGCLVLGFDKLQKELEIKDPSAFLGGTVMPMIMSKYCTIIAGPTSIIGFSCEDATIQFRYPLASDSPLLSMHHDTELKQIHIATRRRLYNIDLSTEEKPVNVRPLREVKEELVSNLQTSKEIRAAEVLSSLLENDKYQDAINMLTNHLRRVVKTEQILKEKANNAAKGKTTVTQLSPRGAPGTSPLSQEKIQQLCEEFFIFELSVIQASSNNENDKPIEFKPQMLVETDGQFDVFLALSKILQLRAFSPVADKIRDKELMQNAKNSPLIVRMLLEDGDVIDAVNKILEFGPQISPESLSSIVFKHRDLLRQQDFYKRIDEKPVRDLVLTILPFIAGDMSSESAYKLLSEELKKPQPRQIDVLLWSLTTSPGAREYDSKVYEELKLKNNSNLISNQFSSMQHCLHAGMYRTAAAIASSAGLHEEAVLAAKALDDKNFIQHFIRRSPRAIQAALCRTAGIEMEPDDDTSAIRAASKDTVSNEIQKMEEKLKKLEEKFEESEEFLQTLQKWGIDEKAGSSTCSVCGRLLNGQSGYCFPCGHSYHETCLIKATKPTLSITDHDKLLMYQQTQSSEYRKWLEETITEECPLCGMKSVQAIQTKIQDDDELAWPTYIGDIVANSKKGLL